MSEGDKMNGDVPNEDEGNSAPAESLAMETPNSPVSSEIMNASTTPVEETYKSPTVPEVKVGVLPASTPDVKAEVSKVRSEKNVNSTVTSVEKNANPADVPIIKSVNTVSSQRKPKLNRRGFYLANNPPVDLLDKKPDQQKGDINGSNDAVETKKIDSSSKRIISLTKSSTGSSSDKITPSKGKIISLKKINSFSAEKREKDVEKQASSSTDPPPKKKHKPITWP